MKNRLKTLLLVPFLLVAHSLNAADWSIPLAGNAFRTAPQPSGDGFRRDGGVAWSDPADVISVFFHLDRPAAIDLSLRARVPQGRSLINARVGETDLQSELIGDELTSHELGRITVSAAGYVRVDLQGVRRSGPVFVEVQDILVDSATEGLSLDFVRSNEGGMFYWGRRGPSVHLRYDVPRDPPLQYAYSEITVPEGQDPIGSYYMANGFGEGYFGFQVNGPEERRVLFSVWSPFQTDNPREIPEEQRIVALARGPDVRIGEFGNEGSGGQSFLVYPWRAGRTYRFLTEVTPDGKGNTVYTSWFGDKSQDEWRLIASFRRPQTDTHLRGFHSFLESFSPTFGHIGRRANYGNVWVRDVAGQWHECTRATFSVDATGGGRHRLDFAGGSESNAFFMRNCGFFSQTGKPGEIFTRDSSAEQKPDVDVTALPRE